MNKEHCEYLRKSRADLEAEARGEGETLKRHEKILDDLASRMGIIVSKKYNEGVITGETIESRPVMQQLLADVEKGKWAGVLVVEVERLARGDTIDQGIVAQAFKYTNTKVITPMKVYDPSDEYDEEYFEYGLFMSRREYKTINRRLQRGRLLSVGEGKYLGSIPPYGYERVKIRNDKGYTLNIIEDEAKIVRLIYKWYIGENRLGISLIMNKLNEMKVPTRKGGDWTTSTLRNVLSNPVYIGLIRWNGRPEKKRIVNGKIKKERPRAKKEDLTLAKGLHEPIVSQNEYDLAQKYLSENPSLPIPTRYVCKNPLSGIVVCGMCGRKMSRRPYNNGYPDTLMCSGPTCKNVSSHLYLVEERLVEALDLWLENYKIEIEEDIEDDSEKELIGQSIKSLDGELELLNKQLNNLHDLLEQGVYTTNVFIERSNLIKTKTELISADKDKLKEQLNKSASKEDKRDAIPEFERIIDLYKSLKSPKEKNKLLKTILIKAEYTKEVGGRWHGKPDDFKLKLYPRLGH